MKGAALLGVLLGLATCNSPSAAPSQPADETLMRESNAGQIAFQLERPEEAIERYDEALRRAQIATTRYAAGTSTRRRRTALRRRSVRT
jgi:hypothetical protein